MSFLQIWSFKLDWHLELFYWSNLFLKYSLHGLKLWVEVISGLVQVSLEFQNALVSVVAKLYGGLVKSCLILYFKGCFFDLVLKVLSLQGELQLQQLRFTNFGGNFLFKEQYFGLFEHDIGFQRTNLRMRFNKLLL